VILKCIDSYNKAVEIDPHLYEVRLNLGIAYYQIQDFESANRELSRVISSQPGNQQAHLLNGLCLVALNRLKEANRELEAVYQADPHNLAAAYALATTYLGTGDTEKARQLADAVFSKVDSAESYLILDHCACGQRVHDAIKDFTLAVSLNPGFRCYTHSWVMPISTPEIGSRPRRNSRKNLQSILGISMPTTDSDAYCAKMET